MKFAVSSLIGLILCTIAVAGHAQSCAQREPTPATGYGPHDFSLGVADSSLWREGDPGELLFLRARVIDRCGGPVAGARVRIVHANHHGEHEAGRWRADLRTDDQGAFRLRTILPGFTGGIPRHIHFIISHPQHDELATRLFFRNDPEFDHSIEQLSMTLEEIRREDKRAWTASYEFVIGDG
jgi:protocatechuate 3,4-dioxygenase beta subunit